VSQLNDGPATKDRARPLRRAKAEFDRARPRRGVRQVFFAAVVVALASLACAVKVSSTTVPRGPVGDTFREMNDAIKDRQYRQIEAVVVLQGGTTFYEGYFGRSGPESRIDARSAGKSITALAVGVAIADGAITDVDAPVFDYFKEMEPFVDDGPIKRAITLRDLLTMSSALDCDDWRSSPGNEERMYRTREWTRFALDIPVAAGYERDPSGYGRFSYCTAGAYLLGRIVERATGQDFADYVQERLFNPLGIDDPQWRRSPTGKVQSGGQLRLRARDFAAIGELVRRGGEVGGTQLVPREWLREMVTIRRSATPQDGYAYLWWVRAFTSGDGGRAGWYMSGNGGNKVVVLPALDAVVVILSTLYNHREMHQQTTEILERFVLPALEAGAPAREPANR